MVNQWRPRVGATSKVWWQVRWPDPMWADDTVVSHPISFHRSEREGGWSSLNKVLAGCSSMPGVPMRASLSASAACLCRC